MVYTINDKNQLEKILDASLLTKGFVPACAGAPSVKH
jgi:hypothetical protein